EYKNTGTRLRANDIINDAAELIEFVGVVRFRQFVNVAIPVAPQHSALGNGHAGGISRYRLFKRDFGAIGKTGDHVDVLVPFSGKFRLCFRSPVGVVEALDISAEERL